MNEMKLKYISSETFYQGRIVVIHAGSVIIDLLGRLGQLRLPKRMIISQNDLQIGQKVGLLMTYPEVLPEDN